MRPDCFYTLNGKKLTFQEFRQAVVDSPELLEKYVLTPTPVRAVAASPAAAEVSPDTTFPSATAVDDYVYNTFGKSASKLGADLSSNMLGDTARYVWKGRQGAHYIEFNPQEMRKWNAGQINAAVREELIHAASANALKARNIDWVDFYTDLGKSLSKEQRRDVKKTYTSAASDVDYGSEYFRMGVQKLLYGTVTEAEVRTTAMQKILGLLKDVVNFLPRQPGQDRARCLRRHGANGPESGPVCAQRRGVQPGYRRGHRTEGERQGSLRGDQKQPRRVHVGSDQRGLRQDGLGRCSKQKDGIPNRPKPVHRSDILAIPRIDAPAAGSRAQDRRMAQQKR